ncbi:MULTISPECIES: cupin domain-containing protein [Pseudomonas]|jgi:Predicted enzyme of the cupin superfamily|uniref:Cupin domain-containing protein n=2 Tax=Pseudomonas TaxID=286 RepID=A0ABY3PY75_9PSED|nr:MULTISPECIES: cupin domain-containing protein [Pseudomonas]QYY80491.1 cupin domain-containing protein [Pseudomonas germanica]UFP98699.1 cupin domain-containing protein [Pseudomonas fitomaticsae]
MNKPECVIDFANPDLPFVESETSDPDLVDIPYRSRIWEHFADPQKKAAAGIWEAPEHLERCECDFDELCHLLEGSVRLTDSNGVSQDFNAGATFVVAAGFKGTWENLTPVRKVFVVLEG